MEFARQGQVQRGVIYYALGYRCSVRKLDRLIGEGGTASPFEQFTDRTHAVLTLAQGEARRLRHNYLGTEHLLLGLVLERNGVAAKVLADLGITPSKARSEIERTIGRGEQVLSGELSLTPRTKRVIELTHDETRRLNHHYIGTEHLLLGLAQEREGVAVEILRRLGATPDRVHSQIRQLLGLPEGQLRVPDQKRLVDRGAATTIGILILVTSVTIARILSGRRSHDR